MPNLLTQALGISTLLFALAAQGQGVEENADLLISLSDSETFFTGQKTGKNTFTTCSGFELEILPNFYVKLKAGRCKGEVKLLHPAFGGIEGTLDDPAVKKRIFELQAAHPERRLPDVDLQDR